MSPDRRTSTSRTARARALCALAATLSLALSACAPVKVYQRGRLSHPSMSASRLGGAGESHMHAIHEGASGGAIGAESGCGCN